MKWDITQLGLVFMIISFPGLFQRFIYFFLAQARHRIQAIKLGLCLFIKHNDTDTPVNRRIRVIFNQING